MLEKILKKISPNKEKEYMDKYLKIKYKLKTLKFYFKEKTDYYLLGTPEYGNLGDHAIAMAEKEFIKDCKKTVTEITSPTVYYNIKGLKKIIKNKPILITGGGFLGSMWMNEENMVRKIIQEFSNNKIIIFPQTVFYENTEIGQKEKEITFELYKKHKNLHIYAREQRTYNFLKNELHGIDIKLVPEIVLYMNKTENINREDKILVCMRNDKEKVENKLIENFLNKQNVKLEYTETNLPYAITEKNRGKELNNKFKQFQTSKLVVTNRLHGMVFAAITSTPCLCMDNLSKKVSGVYEWIKDKEYIKLIDETTDEETLERFLEKVWKNNYNYDNKALQIDFNELKKEIEGENKIGQDC